MEPLRSETFAPIISFTRLAEVMKTIRVLWIVGHQETPKAFWWKAEILEQSVSDINYILRYGTVRCCKYNSYQATNCKLSFLNPHRDLKILRSYEGEEDDSSDVSVRLLEEKEEPILGSFLPKVSIASGLFGSDQCGGTSVGAVITEASDHYESSNVLAETKTISVNTE